MFAIVETIDIMDTLSTKQGDLNMIKKRIVRRKKANPYKVAALSIGFVSIVVLPLSIAANGLIVEAVGICLAMALPVLFVAAAK
jgi:hypothetical protein